MLAIDTILRNKLLNVTDSRMKILGLFQQSKGALTHSQIEKKLKNQLDRVTIYRTLQVFVKKGILHAIPTRDTSILYALCTAGCMDGKHLDDHIHFCCENCETTYCLNEFTVPNIALPKTYNIRRTDFIIRGRCMHCTLPKARK